ncbi:carbon-monoxide dehydrogenase medium subunit [Paraburkholderia sp. HC6.4b]|uniref:FAD binding domain-containing protein n=1 Tax=unclassified Paraburkholderia TaxID=2615204 RepID=UPI00161EFAE7|nr:MULTISPECIES: xanthine dehydrogenase family protein subunit M [unclassified Paraburkholderia]MBB5408242.1 carbon-monoxide dehydrogenase medium subunit [Paraburkholderia sp. HC6.4b]MBB5455766.1 carbon-monoxide dehydrogenase medium subunit [Paraburkholderia sp. Kb1A]
MKPTAFSYHRPSTLDEALSLLALHGFDAKLIAGGQSLAPMMNMRFAQPAHLVDLNALPQLKGVTLEPDTLAVGAMTRHHELATSNTVRAACPLLAEAAATIGHYAIRQRGTLGGSLAHADPAAQLPLIASTLGARIEIVGPAGSREVSAVQFLIAVMTTDLAVDEIIRTVRFPTALSGERHAFEAFSRRHGDFAIAACAVTAVLADDRFASLRIGVGGVADVPLVLDDLAAGFVGETADAPSVGRIAEAVANAVEVHDQPGISAAYRRDLVKALIARALQRITAGVTQPD